MINVKKKKLKYTFLQNYSVTTIFFLSEPSTATHSWTTASTSIAQSLTHSVRRLSPSISCRLTDRTNSSIASGGWAINASSKLKANAASSKTFRKPPQYSYWNQLHQKWSRVMCWSHVDHSPCLFIIICLIPKWDPPTAADSHKEESGKRLIMGTVIFDNSFLHSKERGRLFTKCIGTGFFYKNVLPIRKNKTEW